MLSSVIRINQTSKLSLQKGNRLFSCKPSIPMIDMKTCNDPREMYNACKLGVFYVKQHGIDNALQSELFSESKAFFDLALEEKCKIHVSKGGISWRGYMPIGGEYTHGNIDNKEGLYLGIDHDSKHHRIGTPLYGMNQLPPNHILPEMRPFINKYVEQTTEFGNNLSTLISSSLHLAPSYLMENVIMNDPISIFRLWKYPKIENMDNTQYGIGEHTDYGLLTILQSDIDGLQYKLPIEATEYGEFEWIDVPAINGYFVVGIGDLLDRISYGRFKSREHRVIPSEKQDRYSWVLFYDPSWDFPMKYLPIDTSDKLFDDELNNEMDQIETNKRWSKTAYKALHGKYSDFLTQKVKRVFPDLLQDYQFQHARNESTRFQIAVDQQK